MRVWYRFADQTASKYFSARPRTSEIYLTQDSDLAAFHLHSGGVSFGFPVAGTDGAWEWRVSAFGFHREDDLSAVAVDAGVARQW